MMIGSLGLGICMMMVAALLSQVNEPSGKTYALSSGFQRQDLRYVYPWYRVDGHAMDEHIQEKERDR
jgi:hypothetical protein